MRASISSRSASGVGAWMVALAFGALWAVAPLGARAALIDVQFLVGAGGGSNGTTMVGNAATGSTDVGSGSTGVTTDSWNQYTNAQATAYLPVALTDVTGLSTAVTLTVNNGVTNGGQNLASAPIFHTNNGAVVSPNSAPYWAPNAVNLYNNYLRDGSNPYTQPLTFTFAGVPHGNYNLFIYGMNSNASSGRNYYVTADGTTGGGTGGTIVGPTTLGPNGTTRTMTSPQNFIELTPVVSSSGILTITLNNTGINGSSGSGDQIDVNGLQLQSAPVPEPASLALLTLGGLGLLVRRRKQA